MNIQQTDDQVDEGQIPRAGPQSPVAVGIHGSGKESGGSSNVTDTQTSAPSLKNSRDRDPEHEEHYQKELKSLLSNYHLPKKPRLEDLSQRNNEGSIQTNGQNGSHSSPGEAQQAQQQNHHAPDDKTSINDPDGPQPIPEEICERTIRPRGIARTKALVIRDGTNEPVETTIELMKEESPKQAYMTIESLKPRIFNRGGPDLGKIYLGHILPRVHQPSSTASDADPLAVIFREPTEEEAQTVSIKRLSKSVLETFKNEAEDFEKEIVRMDKIGDNVHVLGSIETLEDDRYLYIISPHVDGGTLADQIALQSMNTCLSSESQVRVMFRQLLEDLQYIHETHLICHRDISPSTCVLHEGRVVLNDLATSHQIPKAGGGWIQPFGRWGKPAYWPPEVLMNARPVHAAGSDLWAAVIVLFNMLTGCNLYSFPHPEDRVFHFFVFCGGFAPTTELTPFAKCAWGELQAMEERQNLLMVVQILQQVQKLSVEVRELFHNVLRLNPKDRWSLQQVLDCRWMAQEAKQKAKKRPSSIELGT